MPERLFVLGLQQLEPGREALWPDPPGSTGHRLWSMAAEADPAIDRAAWIHRTQRANLLPPGPPPRDAWATARARGDYLGPLMARRTVVLLGADAAAAMGHAPPPFVWAMNQDWVMLPHLSGRDCYWDNPVHRAAAGILLTDLLRTLELAPSPLVGV